MEIKIDDRELVGFNEPAKKKLEDVTCEFAIKIIEEANRLESKHNSSGGQPEITSSNISDANILVSKGLTRPKNNWKKKTLKIFGSLLPLFVGMMYNTTKLQEGTYLLLFIGLIVITIVTVTISIIGE